MLRRLNGRSGGEAGFTLIELLIVVLIVGVLAAVGVPLYLGYVRDARLAEGKALLGSVITAAQACAQGDPVNGCNLIQMRDKVGLTNTNNSGGSHTIEVSVSVDIQTGDGRLVTKPPTAHPLYQTLASDLS